jgi:hypothetical protein
MAKKGTAAVGKKGAVEPSAKASVSYPAKPSVSAKLAKASVPDPVPVLPKPSPSSRQTKVQLLWLHSLSPLYSTLHITVLREICSYTADPPLIILKTPKSIHTLDIIKKRKIDRVNLQNYHFCRYSSYAIMSDTKVLSCGGMGNFHVDSRTKIGKALSEVFTAEIATGQTEPLPSMQIAREGCGLIIYSNTAYVFGGSDRGVRNSGVCSVTCESLQLATGTSWERLGDMDAPRAGFNPCLWHSEIFLCDSSSAEIFTPQSNLFRAISLDFPSTKGGCCTYKIGEDLIMLSSNWLTRLKYQAGTLVGESREHEYMNIVPDCQPTVWENRVYVCFRADVIVVEAETGKKISEMRDREYWRRISQI